MTAFADYLRAEAGLLPRTVEQYDGTIARIARETEGPLTPEAAVAWVRERVAPDTPMGTAYALGAAVRHYCRMHDAEPDEPILPPLAVQPLATWGALTDEELGEWTRAVLAADLPPATRTILRILPLTGLRISEACGMRRHPYEARGGHDGLRVLGKGRKVRWVPLRPDAAAILSDHEETVDPGGRWMFPSSYRPGSPLTPDSVRHHVRRLRTSLPIATVVSPHVLRHTAATRMVRAGVPLPVIQAFLGHASLATTERYLHITPADVAAGVDML